MPSLVPLITTPLSASTYDQVRIVDMSYHQEVIGGPSVIRVTWGYYSTTLGDAPAMSLVNGQWQSTRVNTETTLSLAELLSMDGVGAAFTAITAALLAEAIRAGKLQVKE